MSKPIAARRRRLRSRRKQAKRSSRWTAAILVLFAVNVALIGGRSEVVRYLPQTASLFAAIGLPVNLQTPEIRERAHHRRAARAGKA